MHRVHSEPSLCIQQHMPRALPLRRGRRSSLAVAVVPEHPDVVPARVPSQVTEQTQDQLTIDRHAQAMLGVCESSDISIASSTTTMPLSNLVQFWWHTQRNELLSASSVIARSSRSSGAECCVWREFVMT